MARMTIRSTEELARRLSTLGERSLEITKKAVREAANVVADEIKANLRGNLAGSEYSEGDLIDSLGIAPVGVDNTGNVNTKIGFDGVDSKGVPNVLKARAMESGTSKQRKKPFVRPAVRSTKETAERKMAEVFDRETRNIME